MLAVLGACSGLHSLELPLRAGRLAPRHASPEAVLDAEGQLPLEPCPELGPKEAVVAICSGLQYNNWPTQDAGVIRLFNFLTPAGRVAVAPPLPKSGLQGGVTLEGFVAEAGSPALGALQDCSAWRLEGEPVISPGSQARGRLAQQMVEVSNYAGDAALATLIDAPSDVHEDVLAARREGREAPPVPSVGRLPAGKTRFLFSLEEQRRPPQQGCWLLKEMFPMKKSVFQKLNEGGEEFEGADTG